MAGINSLKGLRNVNLSSVKETAKRAAAVTLLLSMTACSLSNIVGNDTWVYPFCCAPLLIGFIALWVKGYKDAMYKSKNPEEFVASDNSWKFDDDGTGRHHWGP